MVPAPVTPGARIAATPLVEAVVVGASAGGVKALQSILPRLSRCRVPILVVVHLPPRRKSLLSELFAPYCEGTVREPFDKEPVSPGVWFAAPDYHLMVERDRTFSLTRDAPVWFSRPSIDVLFESAAEAYGPALVAVVLTGANADGAAGARAVRDAGGTVAVEAPELAEVPTMPRAAIALAAPQFVGSLDEVATFVCGRAEVS
ncbi:MAG: chemotaxis protein CheB [Polyangiaceae bacterium]|nr:chemotaxis protein CheB [Polyangiaceae bacterium]